MTALSSIQPYMNLVAPYLMRIRSISTPDAALSTLVDCADLRGAIDSCLSLLKT
ncbi:hypothetical protein [Arthrobacter sp. MMS18-M83]|uniref:hypothetical protein n=1 Tax=Arthrobacter sp. MMS18-M83 TaxID=2996261 RepID=UPI00227CF843|nr:hypothetical protein [Arthrobacter sp. MMS18-M83]WAH99158.1 hypothetical protein OW521_10195 [Arthrobacter sp. MMS18-M83]